MIASAAGDEFAPQTRVFVHFEHVDARVRSAGRDGFCQREFPTFAGLVRQAGDEIDVDIRNSRSPQPGNVVQHSLALVQAADCGGFRDPRKTARRD